MGIAEDATQLSPGLEETCSRGRSKADAAFFDIFKALVDRLADLLFALSQLFDDLFRERTGRADGTDLMPDQGVADALVCRRYAA